jgi:hypothetical protein
VGEDSEGIDTSKKRGRLQLSSRFQKQKQTNLILQVRALYPYMAQGADELSLQPGETLELSSGPEGGEHYGDGWWEGEI